MGVAQVLLGTLGGSKSGLIEKAVSKNGDFVESLSAFAFPYSDVGLFGLAGTTNDANAAQLVGLMANLMKEVASGNVSSDDVTRAKNLLKMALVDSSASRDGKRDDVATQLLMKGSYTETSDVFAAIDKVTGAQIGTLVSNMLKSSPSISGVGELSTVPGYDRI
ncbi:Uqcrc2, partial [Symbiodinium sp. KB8]